MLARSSLHAPHRWFSCPSSRCPTVQIYLVEISASRRDPQVRASSNAGDSNGELQRQILPDGTLFFSFESSDSKAPPQKQRKVPTAVSQPAQDPAVESTSEPSTVSKTSGVEGHAEQDVILNHAVQDEPDSLSSYTVKQLTEMCKALDIKGYSSLKKAQLVEVIQERHERDQLAVGSETDESDLDDSLALDIDNGQADLQSLTVKELRKACKRRGLKGYSGLRKRDLVEFLSAQS